jgi:hypothetical protein
MTDTLENWLYAALYLSYAGLAFQITATFVIIFRDRRAAEQKQ